MIIKNWKRAGIGACTAAALVVGAGLAFSPAANAAPAADPTTNLLGGVTTGVTGVVSGLLGGSTTPTSSSSSPVTIGTANGGISVGVGSTTVGVTTGSSGIGVGVTTGNSSGVGVVIGSTTTGTTAAVGVTNPSTGTTTTPTGTSTTTPTDTSTPTTTPIVLSALSAVAQYKTVYPAKDGYRDTVAFTLNGTTSDGLQHAAGGTAKLTYGSSTVATWPITATNQVITWNGLKGGKILPGHYIFTATIGSAANSVSGTDSVDVSAKKLASTTQLLTTKSVTGTHKMAAKPLAGLKNGKVTLKVIASATGVKGKQYLVFKHAGKTLKVRIRNGKHTSKAVTIPKTFTSYTISHTWKKGTVKIKSLKYKYTYKALK